MVMTIFFEVCWSKGVNKAINCLANKKLCDCIRFSKIYFVSYFTLLLLISFLVSLKFNFFFLLSYAALLLYDLFKTISSLRDF